MKPGERPLKRDEPLYVLDATATIHFAKISMLSLILEICDAHITREVYAEVVERGGTHPDAMVVRDAIDNGRLKVYEVKDEGALKALLRHPEIHVGEAEIITAARELGGVAVIDEKEARVVANLYRVNTAPGCLFLLFRLLKIGKITINEAEKTLEKLLTSGLYLDPITLLAARKKLREYAKRRKTIPSQMFSQFS